MFLSAAFHSHSLELWEAAGALAQDSRKVEMWVRWLLQVVVSPGMLLINDHLLLICLSDVFIGMSYVDFLMMSNNRYCPNSLFPIPISTDIVY